MPLYVRAKLLFLILLLVSVAASAQTPEHVVVSGTKISLIPPAGFTAASSFSGFEQPDAAASIMISDIPGPIKQMKAAMTPAALATRGMKLLRTEPVTLNGAPATILHVTQSANGLAYRKQMLLFGDATHTVLVVGTYPDGGKTVEASIRRALLTAHYNPRLSDNTPAAEFEVDVAGTGLRFAKNLAGSLLYTTDGQPTPKGPDKAVIIVAGSLNPVEVGPSEQQAFSIQHLQQLPEGKHNRVRTISPVTIDGLSGYEIVADGQNDKQVPELMYQLTLFDGSTNKYYAVVGITETQFDTRLASFKAIARTFKRKKK
ncbi:hypothetical protein [Hymenobacter pini]|uniref:hypothetical protein n=1 Tax=Hymenobacter pini TaxID=2880879 RepID=UPI001CF12610|nr:hypothetical protein [Hymenobacter pini]MCA8831156.1 hypothetical protein [Hymenobacter pini]